MNCIGIKHRRNKNNGLDVSRHDTKIQIATKIFKLDSMIQSVQNGYFKINYTY